MLGAEDILRGDLRAISGLAWSLIVRYQLSGDGKRPTTKKAVLIWIRAALPNENVIINNIFLLFCSLYSLQ